MDKLPQILKRIFFLPPLLTIVIALFGYTFVVVVAVFHIQNPAIQYLSYVCSAYALIITITGIHHLTAFVRSVRQHIDKHPLMEKILSIPLGNRFLKDVRFRAQISLYQGFVINLLYIVMKMVSGIYYRSIWFISIAIYYILLAIMRFMLLRRGKKHASRTSMEIELRHYRLCGITLLLMNQALAAIVALMVQQNKGYEYPGLLIYAMAVYAFYTIIIAVINLIKFRKHGSPVLSAAKAVNFVAAMVSILSLETAMVSQFGEGNDVFRKVMTGATGGGVCIIVLGMAIFMIWKSTRQIKKLQINNSQI